MKKRIYFEKGDYILFKDINSDNRFFGVTKDVNSKITEIMLNYGNRVSNVPDNIQIDVKPFVCFGPKDAYTDIYKPSDSDNILFPINRIEWILVKYE